ncbi:MAG: GNAT family N-acetyltransferase, partial [Oscillospiraceae bacterium]|nr:GNAT family N-acetyltransferase [Oscillospiraceae bacterium]
MNKDVEILSVRECPELLSRAANYFSAKWGINRKIYEESITDSLTTENSSPRWYLMMRGDEIIGSYGLIENDFMVRKDLTPWLCALYIEESERRQGLGAKLLTHGRREAAKLGFSKVYLCTDHVGYYERYGWRFFGMEKSEFGCETRVYEVDSLGCDNAVIAQELQQPKARYVFYDNIKPGVPYLHDAPNIEITADAIIREAAALTRELLDAAKLQRGDIVVVGCSSSEIAGGAIGTSSRPEIGAAVFSAIAETLTPRGIFLAAQCCEHLNRALIIERAAMEKYNFMRVNAIPQPKAGGSFAAAAYAG